MNTSPSPIVVPPVGPRVRQAREECRLTQGELAELAGLRRETLSRIERGHHEAYWDTMCRLSRALGKPLEWFTKSEDEN